MLDFFSSSSHYNSSLLTSYFIPSPSLRRTQPSLTEWRIWKNTLMNRLHACCSPQIIHIGYQESNFCFLRSGFFSCNSVDRQNGATRIHKTAWLFERNNTFVLHPRSSHHVQRLSVIYFANYWVYALWSHPWSTSQIPLELLSRSSIRVELARSQDDELLITLF